MQPHENLFAAAAALFTLTGEAKYRADADRLYSDMAFTFFYSFNEMWCASSAIMLDPAATIALRSPVASALVSCVASSTAQDRVF